MNLTAPRTPEPNADRSIWYLFKMADGDALTLTAEPADSSVSVALQQAFFAEISSRYPGWEPTSSQSVEPSDLAPPTGAWIVAYLDGEPVGCGGLQAVDDETVEIRRVFLLASARGRGIGHALLTELERRAQQLLYQRVRLTTGEHQPEALRLFQGAGYLEIPAFTQGAFTSHWMEKTLSVHVEQAVDNLSLGDSSRGHAQGFSGTLGAPRDTAESGGEAV
jgi:GNAT superfamily N-acetyltransferase